MITVFHIMDPVKKQLYMELKITCTQVEVKALKLPENEIKDYLAADIIERDMTWGEPQYQELYFTDFRKITVVDDGETIYEGSFKDFETGDISEDEFGDYSYLEIGRCEDCELVYDIDDWDPDNMTFDAWVLKLPKDDEMVYDPRYDYCTADEVIDGGPVETTCWFKENGEWKKGGSDDDDEDSNERVKITVTGVAVHVLAANLPDEKIDIISEDLENEELFDDTVASLEDDEDCYKKYLKEIQEVKVEKEDSGEVLYLWEEDDIPEHFTKMTGEVEMIGKYNIVGINFDGDEFIMEHIFYADEWDESKLEFLQNNINFFDFGDDGTFPGIVHTILYDDFSCDDSSDEKGVASQSGYNYKFVQKDGEWMMVDDCGESLEDWGIRVLTEDENTVEANSSIPSITGLNPLVGDEPKILILGTMPGNRSLETGEYYASHTNSFWKFMEQIYNKGKKFQNYNEKEECLKANKVAVWDLAHQCVREGSADKNMKNVVYNDLAGFLNEHPTIELLVFNGKKTSKDFEEHIKIEKKCATAPSTSNAYPMSFEKKLEGWKEALGFKK